MRSEGWRGAEPLGHMPEAGGVSGPGPAAPNTGGSREKKKIKEPTKECDGWPFKLGEGKEA